MTHATMGIVWVMLAVIVVVAIVWLLAHPGIHAGVEHDRKLRRRRRFLLTRSRREADHVAR